MPDRVAGTAFKALLGFPDRADVRQPGLSSILQGKYLVLRYRVVCDLRVSVSRATYRSEIKRPSHWCSEAGFVVADARHGAGCGSGGGTMTMKAKTAKTARPSAAGTGARAKPGRRKPARASAARRVDGCTLNSIY